MSGINKRVFGTPIKGSVREVLEHRQGSKQTNDTVQPESSVTPYTKEFKLDERLPFVRMWTSV